MYSGCPAPKKGIKKPPGSTGRSSKIHQLFQNCSKVFGRVEKVNAKSYKRCNFLFKLYSKKAEYPLTLAVEKWYNETE